jgi:hypothetical protein
MTANDLAEMADERELVLRRLKKRREFQNHLVAFLVVNAAVWVIWTVSGGGYPWPAWLSALWGIGLTLNAWEVYVRRPITEADVERELRRLHSAP